MAEAKYSVNISKSRKKICLSLQFRAVNSYLGAYGVKVYQFKAKGSEIKPDSLCFENIFKRL